VTPPLAIFDLDNTLLDRASAFEGWAHDFVAEHALDPTELDWLRAADGDGFVSRNAFVTAVLARYGLDEAVEVALRELRAGIVERAELFPGAVAGLDLLTERGWLVAIATNGSTAQQWAKIRRHGLDGHVHAVAVSEEVGAAKPDPLMFSTAASRCGIALHPSHWMVGDCATRDVAGAAAAGLRTVWMRRGRTWDPAMPTPNAIADTISEAVDFLRGLAPR
jgi:putative hydrolase of the HAD superfamily